MPDLQRFSVFGRSGGNAVPPVPPAKSDKWNTTEAKKPQRNQCFASSVPLVPPVPRENTTSPGMILNGGSVARPSGRVQARNSHTNLYFLSGTRGTGGTENLSNSKNSSFTDADLYHLPTELGGTGGTATPGLRISRPALLARFEERAAVLEFDGGMSRLDAEAAATQEILASIAAGDAALLAPLDAIQQVTPSPHPTIVDAWRTGFALLSPEILPCPGVRKWPLMHSGMRVFLDQHAEAAADLGWTTLELFGCHPRVGTIRGDCCGALMMGAGQRVVAVQRDLIRFARGLTYRRVLMPTGLSFPVWSFT